MPETDETTEPAETVETEAEAPTVEVEEEFDKDRALATIKKQREAEKAANDRAKALEAKLKEFEDRDKSEAQKLAEAKDTAVQEAAAAKTELIRLRVAMKYGLAEDDLDLLGTGTDEEIEKRAKRLAELTKVEEPEDPKRRPRERLRPGAAPTSDPEPNDPASLAGQVSRSW